MTPPIWERPEDKIKYDEALRRLEASDVAIDTAAAPDRRSALLAQMKVLDWHYRGDNGRWDATQEHLKARRRFYAQMPTSDFVKAAATFGFEALAVFDSSVCGYTMILGRAEDARIMVAMIEKNALYEVEIHGWLNPPSGEGVTFERKTFRHTVVNPRDSTGAIRPIEYVAADLELEKTDPDRVPIDRWWTSGSGAEQTLSWHHNLYTRSEIEYTQYSGRLREPRHQAIQGKWRDIFDLDCLRSHYVEVPEMEAALKALCP